MKTMARIALVVLNLFSTFCWSIIFIFSAMNVAFCDGSIPLMGHFVSCNFARLLILLYGALAVAGISFIVVMFVSKEKRRGFLIADLVYIILTVIIFVAGLKH